MCLCATCLILQKQNRAGCCPTLWTITPAPALRGPCRRESQDRPHTHTVRLPTGPSRHSRASRRLPWPRSPALCPPASLPRSSFHQPVGAQSQHVGAPGATRGHAEVILGPENGVPLSPKRFLGWGPSNLSTESPQPRVLGAQDGESTLGTWGSGRALRGPVQGVGVPRPSNASEVSHCQEAALYQQGDLRHHDSTPAADLATRCTVSCSCWRK